MLFLKIVTAPEAFLGRNSITLYHQISKLGIRGRNNTVIYYKMQILKHGVLWKVSLNLLLAAELSKFCQ